MADEVTARVPASLDGRRVDKALASLLNVSRSRSRVLIEQGVTIDGVVAKARDRVSGGAVIVSPRPVEESELAPEPIPFEVLHEDDSVLVIDKPAGIVVHPGSGRARGTLAAGLLFRYPELRGVGEPDRWGLVHRLDKDTSGALVVARTTAGYEALTSMLKRREIKREYTALAHGDFSTPTGTIDAPIGRDPARPTRRAVVQGGKTARTHYEVLRGYPDQDCSLVSVRLETGRTHQIRVHLSAIDHPIIGDRTYGPKTARVVSPRAFLHASRIEFRHPETGVDVSVESPLPSDLRAVLDSLDN